MIHMPLTDSSNNEEVLIVRDDVGVEFEATGTYMCRADNAVGSANRTVHVSVIGICVPFFRSSSNVISFALFQFPAVFDRGYI